MEMYQYSYNHGLLPESVMKDLISLLPKKNKDTHYVKNMRPLTLLNNDYKILAKTIDNRIREFLPDLIKTDQTGFVKDRKISHNVRKSLDIIDYTVMNKIEAVILSIDMDKCFDRLEHQSIFGLLKYFNFGDSIIKRIKVFYTKFMICTQNFVFLSDFWVKGRGSNQGCPLSPSLYILNAEILANKLCNNSKIKGVKVRDFTYLISQFADDTDLYLSFDQDTVTNKFKTLTAIEANMGLKISYDKTTLHRISSIANTDAKIFMRYKVKWSNEYINTLGIDISVNYDNRGCNLDTVLSKLKAVSRMWYFRNMTLMGKIMIVNSLMASLFMYKLQVLNMISEKRIQMVEQEIEHFIWNGKQPKIKLSILKANKEDGGLGLVDIKMKHRALICQWVAICYMHPSPSPESVKIQ